MKNLLFVSMIITTLISCGDYPAPCQAGLICSYYDGYLCQKEDARSGLSIDCDCDILLDTIDFTTGSDSIFLSTLIGLSSNCIFSNELPAMEELLNINISADEFPIMLSNSRNIEFFDFHLLEGNQTYPAELYNWTNLKTLHLEGDICSFENGFSAYSSLEEIDIRNNLCIQALPDTLHPSLTSIFIHSSSISNISSLKGHLSNLVYLSIISEMSSIPASIGSLQNLDYLRLIGNFNSIPSEIGNLSNLNELILETNSLTSLPSSIGLLPVNKLEISGQTLTQLPDEIGNMPNISTLDLSDNQLSDLPVGIINLNGQLSHIHLSNNQFNNIPVNLLSLTHIKSLSMDNNQLIALPTNIDTLSQINFLSLNNNQLINLPSNIGNLTTLWVFRAINNQLNNVPDEIGNLTNMASLYLSFNQLTTLPNTIANLSDNLENLYLIGNPITEETKDSLSIWLPNTNIRYD